MHEPLHAQNDETNGNIEFLQPYPVVAADALLEIGTAVIPGNFIFNMPLCIDQVIYIMLITSDTTLFCRCYSVIVATCFDSRMSSSDHTYI
jgi:hypothetical protein